MNKINYILILSVFSSFFVFPNTINAKEVCFTQYGGGETCVDVKDDSDIDVDKKISKKDDDYKDHIKSSEHKFDSGDKIYFKIKVENTGDVTLKDVDLIDTLPNFVKFEKEIDGDADVDGKRVKFDIGTLKPGESQTVKFIVEVVDDEDLPNDDKICVTNIARAEGKREDNNKEENDSDYSNFCIDLPEVKGEKPTQLPKAGGGITLSILGLFSTISGFVISRKIGK